MSENGVVLLHGLARSSASMRQLEIALNEAGYVTLNLDYPARRHDIATLAAFVAQNTSAFARSVQRLNFVTHSLGGLVVRSLLREHRPQNLGRVVMLGPPNQGSEIADLLQNFGPYRRGFGPAGQQLETATVSVERESEAIDYPLGIIAADRSVDPLCWMLLPKPNDGKVTVAATKLAGMQDHLTLHATHAFMMRNPKVIRATLAFLDSGSFTK